MTKREFILLLRENPVVAAVKSAQGLEKCTESECGIIFILYGSLSDIGTIVEKVKAAGKTAIVHIDLIEGLDGSPAAVRYIREHTGADGVISTRAQVVKYAREAGLLTVQRFFLIDSMALETVKRHMEQKTADIIEILPGVMPKVVKKLAQFTREPIIAGGLIADKEDIIQVLQAGAAGISSTAEETWFL